jgi:hypothetical protein
MKVGDAVVHRTYGWIGVIVKYRPWEGYWVHWSSWPVQYNPDGPMQGDWLRIVDEDR